jgi:hypothetical protein
MYISMPEPGFETEIAFFECLETISAIDHGMAIGIGRSGSYIIKRGMIGTEYSNKR